MIFFWNLERQKHFFFHRNKQKSQFCIDRHFRQITKTGKSGKHVTEIFTYNLFACIKVLLIESLPPHSSELRGFCLMKWPGEMLQNLPYFIYTKTQICFFRFSFHATLLFSLVNAHIDRGIH